MKAKTFEYKGYTFEPVGNLLGNFKEKTNKTNWAYKLEIENYSYNEFYKIAKQNHASCDIFKVNGKLYIPCNTCFVGIINGAEIKTLDQYSKWYH